MKALGEFAITHQHGRANAAHAPAPRKFACAGDSNFTRRGFSGLACSAVMSALGGRSFADPLVDPLRVLGVSPDRTFPQFDEAAANVIPEAGFQSRIALKDSVVRIVRHGVIDRGKFFDLRLRMGPLPPELNTVLSEVSELPIKLTRGNAADYVNLLWPVGLANHIYSNFQSPLKGSSLAGFASTGGWTLGKKSEGSTYFNRYPIVALTPEAEILAVRVAQSTYRPCCGNSTFFQDCNHGSALFGVLQLGASQGLQEQELFQEALAFNSFWFPDYYIKTALYFSVVRKTQWRDIDARLVMGQEFSALGPWQENVNAKLAAIPDLIPAPLGGAVCGA